MPIIAQVPLKQKMCPTGRAVGTRLAPICSEIPLHGHYLLNLGQKRKQGFCPPWPSALATSDYGFAHWVSYLRVALADLGRRRLPPPSNYCASSLCQEWQES